jgi:hypothetical protein
MIFNSIIRLRRFAKLHAGHLIRISQAPGIDSDYNEINVQTNTQTGKARGNHVHNGKGNAS